MSAFVQMLTIDAGVLALGLGFLLWPRLALAFQVRRNNKARQLEVVVSLGAPAPIVPTPVRVDMRSRTQRLEDQDRVNRLGFPRGTWAVEVAS